MTSAPWTRYCTKAPGIEHDIAFGGDKFCGHCGAAKPTTPAHVEPLVVTIEDSEPVIKSSQTIQSRLPVQAGHTTLNARDRDRFKSIPPVAESARQSGFTTKHPPGRVHAGSVARSLREKAVVEETITIAKKARVPPAARPPSHIHMSIVVYKSVLQITHTSRMDEYTWEDEMIWKRWSDITTAAQFDEWYTFKRTAKPEDALMQFIFMRNDNDLSESSLQELDDYTRHYFVTGFADNKEPIKISRASLQADDLTSLLAPFRRLAPKREQRYEVIIAIECEQHKGLMKYRPRLPSPPAKARSLLDSGERSAHESTSITAHYARRSVSRSRSSMKLNAIGGSASSGDVAESLIESLTELAPTLSVADSVRDSMSDSARQDTKFWEQSPGVFLDLTTSVSPISDLPDDPLETAIKPEPVGTPTAIRASYNTSSVLSSPPPTSQIEAVRSSPPSLPVGPQTAVAPTRKRSNSKPHRFTPMKTRSQGRKMLETVEE